MKEKATAMLVAFCAGIALTACGSSDTAMETAQESMTAETAAVDTEMAAGDKSIEQGLPYVEEDSDNKAEYASQEEYPATEFDWYKWNFAIDPDLDCVGEAGDGIGTIYFRLFVPETKTGEKYPLVLNLGGLGANNAILKKLNSYAYSGASFASDVNQEKNPSYVLTFNVPFEACVNYEAELDYVYQFGEIAKWVNEEYSNVDMDRIYTTGKSQGAGWSYELAAVQPDLLAAALINAGTLVHTTWGNECDTKAIVDSDVNLYIWHGFNDIYIPVNEAYRAYNSLTSQGKKNVILDIDDCVALGNQSGHTNPVMYTPDEISPYMDWLYTQVKGIPCTEEPEKSEEGSYADYKWAGINAFAGIDGWTTANDYANWVEPADNNTWDLLKSRSQAVTEGAGGTGKTWLGKIRIGDETSTSYDDALQDNPIVTIKAGDTAAITVQGYTGAYGDDWDAFNKEWSVDWAVLNGSVTNIELTHEASSEPIVRPDTVTLANGGGPNVNNSLYNANTLDGKQVYVKIDTAENYEGNTLKVAVRFTRKLDNGEYASYYHIVNFNVK